MSKSQSDRIVQKWGDKPYMQAADMALVTCPRDNGQEPLVGLDLHAKDGKVFAHAHFSVECALDLLAALDALIGKIIQEQRKGKGCDA